MFTLKNHRRDYLRGYALIGLWALFFWSGVVALTQNTASPANTDPGFSTQATHVLGLEKTKNNCSGTLLIQDDKLQFQQKDQTSTPIKIASVRGIFLGEEDKQVGGLPMTLGKAAAPYGAGRVISLFAHKKYDILALEYVDGDGGIHGTIFELGQGQGKLLRDHLVALGAHVRHNDEIKQNNEELHGETK